MLLGMSKKNLFLSKYEYYYNLDLALDKIFNEENSLLVFLKASLAGGKSFRQVNIKILVLFKSLIERYKTKVLRYANGIIQVNENDQTILSKFKPALTKFNKFSLCRFRYNMLCPAVQVQRRRKSRFWSFMRSLQMIFARQSIDPNC